jgi:hypothetical protein
MGNFGYAYYALLNNKEVVIKTFIDDDLMKANYFNFIFRNESSIIK